ncbi:excinuclease ABC subunit UvrC [bacterium]|nr:excinuclease ABC subunit UvrC [bacterium]
MNDTTVIEQKLKILPAAPGVYTWKDARGQVIYVGKAKSLRHRVRSYFQQPEAKDVKTQLLVTKCADVDWIVTESEKAALILENTLIKRHRPPYNIRLRDDKNFLSIKLSMRDKFPRLYLVRRVQRDGSLYYGPFSNAFAARATFNFLSRHFPLRECSDGEFSQRTRPCIRYQIGRSAGPCCGMVSEEEYAKIVHQVRLFFEGRGEDLVRDVEREMERAAGEERFEQAARLRDLADSLRTSLEKQRAETTDMTDRDVWAIYREGASGVAVAMFVRAGKTIGQRAFPFSNQEHEDAEVLGEVMQAYYADDGFVPGEILAEVNPQMSGAVEEWLTDLRGARVRLGVPQRGDKARYVEIARENAKQQFEQRRSRLADTRDILESVRRALHLTRTPIVVECFDISNFHGTNAVGSQVTFVEGKPDTSRYRRYKIRTKDTPDDYAMMREVLGRRVARARENDEWPDLLLVDGGRGQLAVAEAVLAEIDARDLPIAAVTKIRDRAEGDRGAEDMVYLPGRKNPVTFPRGSTALFFIQRVRDEAHRFAVAYHRKLRGKSQVTGALDAIDGVGAARRRALIRHFGSLKRIREASADEIAAVPGINADLARRIHDRLTVPDA